MSHQPHPQPTDSTDPPYDPALAGHLLEIKEICRQIGAIEMRVLRDAEMAWLYYETVVEAPGNPNYISPSKDRTIGELRLPKSGTIFVARFSATDGGVPGLE